MNTAEFKKETFTASFPPSVLQGTTRSCCLGGMPGEKDSPCLIWPSSFICSAVHLNPHRHGRRMHLLSKVSLAAITSAWQSSSQGHRDQDKQLPECFWWRFKGGFYSKNPRKSIIQFPFHVSATWFFFYYYVALTNSASIEAHISTNAHWGLLADSRGC